MKPTSEELSSVKNTVPSDSEHQFLVEAIDSHRHKEVAKVQLQAQLNIKRLEIFLEEERGKKKNIEELNYLEIAIQRKIDEIKAERAWAIKVIDLDRNDLLTKLHTWENR